jgi:hypothetical protein
MKANELQIINFLQDPMYNSRIPVSKELRLDAECKELLNDIISVETEIEEHILLVVLYLFMKDL